MSRLFGSILTLVLAAMVAPRTSAQEAAATGGSPARDTVSLPLQMTRSLRMTTEEGTWMSLDVSPDGSTLVFDLVGDLYTLPMGGGIAKRITDGPGFDSSPRFSPDGRTIVFVSDRSGSENLWLVNPDGSRLRQISRGDKEAYVSPEWTPDGNYVVVSRSGSGFLATQYDLALIHRDGGTGIKLTGQGTGAAPTGPPNPFVPRPFSNYLGAAFGADGRYIYAAVKRGGLQYNQQLDQRWQIAVYDRETGQTFVRTNAIGGGMRPALSPDGKYMAYGSRQGEITGLRLQELASGDERWLASSIQRDDSESLYSRDLLPGFAFTPDSRAVVISYGGKFWRVDVATGEATPIPFSAEIAVGMGPQVKFAYPINDSSLTVRQIRGATPSPDGRRLAFTALDKLWIMDVPGGTPRRVTTSSVGEHSPSWSPDGRYLAYVTWTEQGGDIFRVRADGRGSPERLTRESAFYEHLTYSANGNRLVAARGPRQQRIERENEFEGPGAQVMELVWLPANGGTVTRISPLNYYGRPHFTRDTSRVFIYDPADGLVSMRYDGTDRRPIIRITGYTEPGAQPPTPSVADEIQISPDGTRAAALVNNKVYLVAVPVSGGATPTVSVTDPAAAPVPTRRVTRIGGDWLRWNRDGRTFHYSLGRSFFTYDVARADSLVGDSTARADSVRAASTASGARADSAAKSTPAYEPARIDITITVPKDRPRGVVALRGARIITMRGDEVIASGDIVVTDNRITALGPSGSVQVPAGAHTIDVTGKTVIPGWIDVHAHMWPLWGVHKTQVYEYLANLAYGVTTTRDPQTSTTDVLSYGDLVETGDMLGPRVFSTGPGVFWSDDISSLEDAREVLRRYSEFYQTNTIKQYLAGNRKVRQWVIMASRELGLMPTLEGGLDFEKNLTEAIDGYSGVEHSLPIAPMYRDAVRLFAESGITYTPTLLVQYGGPWAENYWYERYDIMADPKLRRFTPYSELARRALRRPGWFRESEYSFRLLAEQAAKIVASGGRVGLGSHGQLQGLGAHWELWTIASGGMPNHDVLRVGTIFGAEAIGLERDLGSLEPGKLADLQVLDADPLENIRNTNTIRYVMKNGRLYETATLTEIWPRRREIQAPWWWTQEGVAPKQPSSGSR